MSGESSSQALKRSLSDGEEYEWAGVVKLRTTYKEAVAFAGSRLTVLSKNDNDEAVDVESHSDFGDDQYSEINLTMESEDSQATILCTASSRSEGTTEHLEQLNAETKTSLPCSICLDNMHIPVVSTACWHIHCEQCWIRCLQMKKSCPKCNIIVLPSNLRRVYF